MGYVSFREGIYIYMQLVGAHLAGTCFYFFGGASESLPFFGQHLLEQRVKEAGKCLLVFSYIDTMNVCQMQVNKTYMDPMGFYPHPWMKKKRQVLKWNIIFPGCQD